MIHRGSRLQHNGTTAGSRIFIVTRVMESFVEAIAPTGRYVTILKSNIHVDDKHRKTGYKLLEDVQ